MFPLQPDVLSTDAEPGAYHMWWPTADEPSFTSSAALPSIIAAYDATSGVEAQFFRELVGLSRAAEHAVYVACAGSPAFFVTADPEKGIRLHFDPRYVSPAQRNEVWAEYAGFARSYRSRLERSVLFRMRSRFVHAEPPRWLRLLISAVSAMEGTSDPPQAVGSYLLGSAGV